jgi:hypothetical protein
MRTLFFVVVGIFLAVQMRSCFSERYKNICSSMCSDEGHVTGYMVDRWSCQCEGFKKSKDKRIIRP